MSAPVAEKPPTSEPGADAIDAAARGDDLTRGEERGALSYLLGARKPSEHTVTVQFLTEDGPKPVTFTIRQLDGRQLDRIEQQNISDTTGRVDQITANCQIVAEAAVSITDETGESAVPKSEAFRTIKPGTAPLASPADAIEARFRTQLGLIAGVASEVRRISGWDPDAVGKAQRKLVEAAGN